MIGFSKWLESERQWRAWAISPEGEAYSAYSHDEIAEKLGVLTWQLSKGNWAQISTFSNGRCSFHQNLISHPALQVAKQILGQYADVEVITKNGYKTIPMEEFLASGAADLNKMSRSFSSVEYGTPH